MTQEAKKPSAVSALRMRRAAMGLKRLEVYAHEDDHPAIKALADRLLRARERAAMAAAAKPEGG